MSQATFTFRVDEELKAAFATVAEANDRSGAQVLRDFMRRYVQEHADKVAYDQWFRAKVEEGRLAAARGEVYTMAEMEEESALLRQSLREQGKR